MFNSQNEAEVKSASWQFLIFFFMRFSDFFETCTLKVDEKLFFLIYENCDVTIFKHEKNLFLCRNSEILVQNRRRGQAFFLGFFKRFPLQFFIKGFLLKIGRNGFVEISESLCEKRFLMFCWELAHSCLHFFPR